MMTLMTTMTMMTTMMMMMIMMLMMMMMMMAVMMMMMMMVMMMMTMMMMTTTTTTTMTMILILSILISNIRCLIMTIKDFIVSQINKFLFVLFCNHVSLLFITLHNFYLNLIVNFIIESNVISLNAIKLIQNIKQNIMNLEIFVSEDKNIFIHDALP